MLSLFRKKDHISDWMQLSEDEKTEMVGRLFNAFVPNYLRARFIRRSPEEISNLINNINVIAENEQWFTILAEQTTAHYKDEKSNKASSKVIRGLISNHVKQYLGLG